MWDLLGGLMDWFSPSEGSFAADYLMGPESYSADYLLGSVPEVSAPSGMSSILSGSDMGNVFSSGGSLVPQQKPQTQSFDWWNMAKQALPIAGPIIGSLIGARSQSNMAQSLGDAERAAYEQYLANLQTPESVKEMQYKGAKQAALQEATNAQRRLQNTMAQRGIKGQGIVQPINELQHNVAKQNLGSYLDIYGKYNVPNQLPPTNMSKAMTTQNMMGKQMGDLATLWGMKNIFA